MYYVIFGTIILIIAFLLFRAAVNKAKFAEQKLEEANNIRITKNTEQEEYNNLISSLLSQINKLTKEKDSINSQISALQNLFLEKKEKIQEQIAANEKNISYAGEQYVAALEKEYKRLESNFDKAMKQLQQQEEDYKNQILKMREALAAHSKAALREREKKDKLDFYKLSLSSLDLEDVLKLNSIKPMLHQPVVLSKVIWTTYFQKQTTEMCNRVLGTDKVCGIYKITNIETDQSYIGQSVDISQRWKDHIKCGLGIEAPATNKLYNAMQNKGVWNFTFELLETCPRDQLNEKEKFWIESYQSHLYGYNSTKGNG